MYHKGKYMFPCDEVYTIDCYAKPQMEANSGARSGRERSNGHLPQTVFGGEKGKAALAALYVEKRTRYPYPGFGLWDGDMGN